MYHNHFLSTLFIAREVDRSIVLGRKISNFNSFYPLLHFNGVIKLSFRSRRSTRVSVLCAFCFRIKSPAAPWSNKFAHNVVSPAWLIISYPPSSARLKTLWKVISLRPHVTRNIQLYHYLIILEFE